MRSDELNKRIISENIVFQTIETSTKQIGLRLINRIIFEACKINRIILNKNETYWRENGITVKISDRINKLKYRENRDLSRYRN